MVLRLSSGSPVDVGPSVVGDPTCKATVAARSTIPATPATVSLVAPTDGNVEWTSDVALTKVAPPAAVWVAPMVETALIVEQISAPGTAADAQFWDRTRASVAEVNTTPRRVNRPANRS